MQSRLLAPRLLAPRLLAPRLLAPLLLAILPAACGGWTEPPKTTATVSVSLSWRKTGDLDLHVGRRSTYTMGGSPDMTLGGGSEAYVFPVSGMPDSIVVGVINRSAEVGGSGATGIRAILTISDRSSRTVTIEKTMDTEPWDAFIVYPPTGRFEVIEP
jgi:hypothetical protein